jgi:hypothetical protein
MSITGKIKETTEKLKDKLTAQKDAVREEARHETSESKRVAEDIKGEARHETTESERIAADLRKKAEERAAEAKEHFGKR